MAECVSGKNDTVHTVLVMSELEARSLKQFFIDEYHSTANNYDEHLENVAIAIGAL